MEEEYMVVIYSKITELEEYEYFDNEEDSIEYAKDMCDKDTITSVWLDNECIYESEV